MDQSGRSSTGRTPGARVSVGSPSRVGPSCISADCAPVVAHARLQVGGCRREKTFDGPLSVGFSLPPLPENWRAAEPRRGGWGGAFKQSVWAARRWEYRSGAPTNLAGAEWNHGTRAHGEPPDHSTAPVSHSASLYPPAMLLGSSHLPRR